MKKLLVIDIDNKMLEVLSNLFGRFNVGVAKAGNARQAAGILAREHIDVVLLDTIMPTVDGKLLYNMVTTCKPACKVIVSSAYPVEFQKRSIPEAFGYHQKSEGAKALFEKLLSVCK